MRRILWGMSKDRVLGAGAGLVLVASLLISLRIGTYAVPPTVRCGTHCTPALIAHAQQELGPQTPDWAIPVALAVGIGGATLAVLIFRRGPSGRGAA
jgi:hypothetical protein